MELQIEVEGIRPGKAGRLLVFFFGDRGFPKEHDKALQTESIALRGERTVARLTTSLRGDIALKILHDDDESGLVRKKFGFIPDKGIGYSRGARITWRIPRFEECALRLEEGVELLRVPVSMQYL